MSLNASLRLSIAKKLFSNVGVERVMPALSFPGLSPVLEDGIVSELRITARTVKCLRCTWTMTHMPVAVKAMR